MNQLYLDHNATTPIHPTVAEAMAECYRAGYANAASQHQAGQRARRVIEQAREDIASFVGAVTETADADRVIFTSGGTEANNLAVFGLAGHRGGNVVVSTIEHPSINGPVDQLARRGAQVRRARVSPDGVVDLDQLNSLIDAETRLVSVMLGNNETGVLQPVAEIARLCVGRRVTIHTDAVQVVGKLPVNFRQLGVDALTISAHKFHGPRGIGVLLLRHSVTLEPLQFGGFQQLGFRPGTEPVELAVGMRRALELWDAERNERAARLAALRDRFEALITAGDENVSINGAEAPRLPHTSNLSFVGLDRQALVLALDAAGVACSTGSACASGSSEPSPVLLAMGCSPAIVAGSLRFSFGASTTLSDVEEAARRILQVANHLRRAERRGKDASTARHSRRELL